MVCFLVAGEDLIAPCNCKGTQKHVHRSCLDNWRSTKVNYCHHCQKVCSWFESMVLLSLSSVFCFYAICFRKVLHFRIVQSVEPSSNSEPMYLLIDGG